MSTSNFNYNISKSGEFYEDKYKLSCDIFKDYFENGIKYCHINAFCQQGKTSIIHIITLLLRKNKKLTNIPISNIFIFTGMSDTSWIKQTRERLHKCFKNNIFHSPTIKKMSKLINDNIFLIWDESHTASAIDNTISKELKCLHNGDLFKKNIYLLTLSASSPCEIKHIDMINNTSNNITKNLVSTRQIPLSKNYTSIKTLFQQNRVKESQAITDDFIIDLMVEMLGFSDLKYHFIRLHGKSYEINKNIITNVNTNVFDNYFNIEEWNSKIKKGKNKDINNILSKSPTVHTIYIIKEMFRSSKTLNDKHIGILVDRPNKTKTSTTLQSFVGRLSGYNRSEETIVYTNLDNAEKSLEIFEKGWLQTAEWDAPHIKMDKKKQLSSTGKEIQAFITGEEKKIERENKKEDIKIKIFERKDYKTEIDFKEDINTFYREIKKGGHCPKWKNMNEKNEKGFVLSTIRGVNRIFTVDEILSEKRAGLSNKCIKRINICYKSLKNKKSKCAIVKYIEQKTHI